MPAKRRFLFVIRSYAPDAKVGGGAKSVRNLAEGLQARGHDVHIARLVPKGQAQAWRDAADKAGVIGPGKPKLHFLPIRNLYWPFDLKPHGRLAKAIWHVIDLSNGRAATDLRRLIAEVRPDVVNTSIIDGFSTAIFAAAKVGGARLVHTMRDYYLVCTRSGMFKRGRNCETLCSGCAVSAIVRRGHAAHVDLFLANSSYVAEANRRFGGFPADRRALVQWNVNERAAISAPRDLNEEVVTFGFIGRVAPSKGLEKLLEAAVRLPADEGRPWRLVIAGGGEPTFEAELRDRYGSDPRIRFLGWSDAADFYGSIDVLCCPSTYNEPLPRVIYEGYGFALPTVAANTGGIPEIVEHGGPGVLYEAEDVVALASLLQGFRTMSADDYRRMSAAALEMADQFAPDAVISTYESRIDALFGVSAAAADEERVA